MKVKKLIEELQKVDPELEVLASADSEGNAFGHGVEIDPCHYTGNNWTDIEVENERMWKENEREGDYPGNNCVVIWT